MLSRKESKYIQSLCHKKYREEEGLFIVEGVKMVDELLQSDYTIKKIYALQDWMASHNIKNLEIVEVSEAELQSISALQTANKVLAVVEQKRLAVAPVIKNKLTIVLDGIQDPGNLGTIIRIADWFGITQIICSNDTVELYNPKVIQSTMGSFARVNIWYKELNKFLENASVPVFGALLNGKNIYEMQKPKEGFLIIGNESKGIRENILRLITQPITIPKKGNAESLNAAVATAILLSHLT
jgi:TrmH family RNA methyltransferase